MRFAWAESDKFWREARRDAWEKFRDGPHNRFSLLWTINNLLKSSLIGPKRVEQLWEMIRFHRTKQGYWIDIVPSTTDDLNRIELRMSNEDVQFYFSVPRGEEAPFRELLTMICKVDRAILSAKKLKSQPLQMQTTHTAHANVRIEIVSKGQCITPESFLGIEVDQQDSN